MSSSFTRELRPGSSSLDCISGQQVSWWGTDNVYVMRGVMLGLDDERVGAMAPVGAFWGHRDR